MQVSSSQADGKQLTATTASRTKGDAPKAAEAAKSSSTDQPASSTKVTLSDSAKQMQADESKKADAGKAEAASTSAMAKSADAEKTAEKPSAMKSLAYGALGLPSPEEQAKSKNQAYSAGKWIAALGTVGGVIAMLARFL